MTCFLVQEQVCCRQLSVYKAKLVFVVHTCWITEGRSCLVVSMLAGDAELILGALVAGMFPAVATVQQRITKASIATLADGTANLGMASVNAMYRFFPHRWLAYNDKVWYSPFPLEAIVVGVLAADGLRDKAFW